MWLTTGMVPNCLSNDAVRRRANAKVAPSAHHHRPTTSPTCPLGGLQRDPRGTSGLGQTRRFRPRARRYWSTLISGHVPRRSGRKTSGPGRDYVVWMTPSNESTELPLRPTRQQQSRKLASLGSDQRLPDPKFEHGSRARFCRKSILARGNMNQIHAAT